MTLNLKKREYNHRSTLYRSSVRDFCEKKGIDIPTPIILEDNLTLEESKKREQYWIEYYKRLGYNLLNRTKGGDSVGTLLVVKIGNETNLFIEKSRQVHGDKYDYSKVCYEHSQKKVCVICPTHGEFLQIPNSHLMGSGCPKCKNEKTGERCRYSNQQFITKSRQVHGDMYDYSKVEYRRATEKVEIICKVHGVFYQRPHNHLCGQGCPKCGFKRTVESCIKWTYERCNEESKKYNSRTSFYKGCVSAYKASLKNGWLDEFFPKRK